MPIEARIRALGFDVPSALKKARAGKIEAWVHRYLSSGDWANHPFVEGLNRHKRWWRGPLELPLGVLEPAVGPKEGMEYRVDAQDWRRRISTLAETFSQPRALPPLIAEYRGGALSLRDGNTRHAAMHLKGWQTCWVIVWYNSKEEFRFHGEELVKGAP